MNGKVSGCVAASTVPSPVDLQVRQRRGTRLVGEVAASAHAGRRGGQADRSISGRLGIELLDPAFVLPGQNLSAQRPCAAIPASLLAFCKW
jgi:hypothetical protein